MGIDQISGKFLRFGTRVLVKPISEIYNLSMALKRFFEVKVKASI